MRHKSGFSAAGTSGADLRKGAVRMFCNERPAVFAEKQDRPSVTKLFAKFSWGGLYVTRQTRIDLFAHINFPYSVVSCAGLAS